MDYHERVIENHQKFFKYYDKNEITNICIYKKKKY